MSLRRTAIDSESLHEWHQHNVLRPLNICIHRTRLITSFTECTKQTKTNSMHFRLFSGNISFYPRKEITHWFSCVASVEALQDFAPKRAKLSNEAKADDIIRKQCVITTCEERARGQTPFSQKHHYLATWGHWLYIPFRMALHFLCMNLPLKVAFA